MLKIKPIRISLDYEEADFVRRTLSKAWLAAEPGSNQALVLHGVIVDVMEKVREAHAEDDEVERLLKAVNG